MNTDDLRHLLNAHGICEKFDDIDMHGLPDLVLFSGGHAIFIFTDGGELQNQFMKKLSFQLAPHFIWKYLSEFNAMQQYDSSVVFVPMEMRNAENVVEWLDYIEEENKDFDYLEKYEMES